MAADREFFKDLTNIRILKPVGDIEIRKRDRSIENDDRECRTPTAKEHKIPMVLTCPPAPMKPKGPVVSCKRRLTELEFFEIANRDEVNEFFRSAFETTTTAKRRCRDLKF